MTHPNDNLPTVVRSHLCCGVTSADSVCENTGTGIAASTSKPSRSCSDLAGWIVSGAGLALVPKCPACIAAYIALGTGIGVSMSTATYLRTILLTLFALSLLYLAARRIRHFIGFDLPQFIERE